MLEQIQRRWTNAVSGMADVPYGERLKILDLFSFKGCLLSTDLILVWKIIDKQCAIECDYQIKCLHLCEVRDVVVSIRYLFPEPDENSSQLE